MVTTHLDKGTLFHLSADSWHQGQFGPSNGGSHQQPMAFALWRGWEPQGSRPGVRRPDRWSPVEQVYGRGALEVTPISEGQLHAEFNLKNGWEWHILGDSSWSSTMRGTEVHTSVGRECTSGD